MQESVSQDRDKFIGGSDIPIIMEVSPFKSRFDLLLEKAGYKKNEFKGNVFTEYGNTMESKIRDYVNTITGEALLEGKHIMDVPKDWCENPNGMRIRCHTDGECCDTILEIKTTAEIYTRIDDYYIYLVQILFYMAMTGKENGLLAVYRRPDDFSIDEEFDENKLQIWEIHLTDYHDEVENIKNAVSKFLDDLQKVKSNPFITEEELMPADVAEITKRIISFEQQISRMKELEKKIKDDKERLKNAMVNAGVKKWETPNGYKITLIPDSDDKVEEVTAFNAERFMAEHPELVDEYMETKKEIKKGKKGYVKITAPKEDK